MIKERRGLVVALTGGIVASYLLRRARPVGRELNRSSVLDRVTEDRLAPRSFPHDHDLMLVVFTDYQCPACRRADPAMQAALIHDGRVGVMYKEWPIFGRRSEDAARVAIAGYFQGKYAAMHDALMRFPGALDQSVLQSVATGVGIDWTRVEADLRARKERIDRTLSQAALDAFSLGLQGTPAYLAGRVVAEGALSEAEFRSLFVRARASGI